MHVNAEDLLDAAPQQSAVGLVLMIGQYKKAWSLGVNLAGRSASKKTTIEGNPNSLVSSRVTRKTASWW